MLPLNVGIKDTLGTYEDNLTLDIDSIGHIYFFLATTVLFLFIGQFY